MLICLWKGCEFVSEDMAAFQEHLITKHAVQQQLQPQLTLDKQSDVGTAEVEESQIAKLAELNLEEDKLIKRGEKRQKIIFLAMEVWVDVLGFIRRIQLARSVCLVNWKIYDICWPRLHGDKVRVHEVKEMIIASRHELGLQPAAILLIDRKEVPFPECPPPGYITGFRDIQINFLDHQVLAFFSLLAPRIATSKVGIDLEMRMSNLEENQRASVNQLLQMFREKITTINSIYFNRCLSNIQFVPDVDNKLDRIDCCGIEESDIPILVEFLASPRPDGQQRVMRMHFCDEQLHVAQTFLDAIKAEFRSSTLPMPQPFFLQIGANLDIPQSEEENLQTDETLTIMPNPIDGHIVSRHPRGQHELWAEDASKRLIDGPTDEYTAFITVNISEFGVPFSMDSI